MSRNSGSRGVQSSPAGVEAIEAKRISRNWTRQALADRAGIHLDTLKRLIRRVNVDRESVRRIAEALELLPTEIVDRSEWMPSTPAPEPQPILSSVAASCSKILIWHCGSMSDYEVAEQLGESLRAAGYEGFVAEESQDTELQHLDEALEACDYLVLLLSTQAATSEMMTKTIQQARKLQSIRSNHKPGILLIYLGASAALNHDQRGYLQGLRAWEWRSSTDTPIVVAAVLNQLRLSAQGVEAMLLPISPPAEVDLSPLPLPVAEPELPEGQVELASVFYVERPPIETRCYAAIDKPGALIRIKAARQMGKTSLMARILYQASQLGHLAMPLSFQLADGAVFSDLDKFLRWFCASITWHLGLADRLGEHWNPLLGSKMSCTSYFEKYLLKNIDCPLTIGLDEVDLVFQHPEIACDFLGLLRAWHESAKNREIWRKLRLVVVHSTEVYVPLSVHQSPFNVGLAIELPEFTLDQVHDLAQRQGLNWEAAHVQQLMTVVGGHPFLIRLALYQIAQQAVTLDSLLKAAPTEAGIYSDHLRRHLWNLEQNPDLAIALHHVLSTDQPVRLASIQAFKLHSLGLIHLQNNTVAPRCELYRHYFSTHLDHALRE